MAAPAELHVAECSFLGLDGEAAVFSQKLHHRGSFEQRPADFLPLPLFFIGGLLGFVGLLLLIDELLRPEALPDDRLLDLVGGVLMLACAWFLFSLARKYGRRSEQRDLQRQSDQSSIYALRFDRLAGQCLLLGPFRQGEADTPFLMQARKPVLASMPLSEFRLSLELRRGRSLPWSDVYDEGEYDFSYFQLLLIPARVPHPGFAPQQGLDLFEGLTTSTNAGQEPVLPPEARERQQLAEAIFTNGAASA